MKIMLVTEKRILLHSYILFKNLLPQASDYLFLIFNVNGYTSLWKKTNISIIWLLTLHLPKISIEEIIFFLKTLYHPTCMGSILKSVIHHNKKAYLGPSVQWKISSCPVKLSGGLTTEILSGIHSRRWYLGL